MNDDSHALKIGHEFESYVANLFAPDEFSLLKNRSDRRTGHHWPTSSFDPDLEWKHRATGFVFAVECKFRSHWRHSVAGDSGLVWCEPHQLKNYRSFSRKRQILVYIALGVGGTASRPDEMYIIPLRELAHNTVAKIRICQFRSENPRGSAALKGQNGSTCLYQRDVDSVLLGNRRPMDPVPVSPPRFPQAPAPSEKVSPRIVVESVVLTETRRAMPTVSVQGLPSNVRKHGQSMRRRLSVLTLLAVIALSVAGGLWLRARRQPVSGQRQLPQATSRSTPSARLPIPVVASARPSAQGQSQNAQAESSSRQPLLRHQPEHQPFRLAIHRVGPVSVAQMAQGKALATKAAARFASDALPPFFAVPTRLNRGDSPLEAYMVFDTAKGEFAHADAFVANAQPVGTVAFVGRFPCFFVGEDSK